MYEVSAKAERVKPLFQRMELFIDFCEEAVDRAFYMAGMTQFAHISIKPSADERAYQRYVTWCKDRDLPAADVETWDKVHTSAISYTQGLVTVKASNRTGG